MDNEEEEEKIRREWVEWRRKERERKEWRETRKNKITKKLKKIWLKRRVKLKRKMGGLTRGEG